MRFDLHDAAPQGNRTVRFRARLGSGEKISHKAIKWIYVTKEWWREQGSPAVLNGTFEALIDGVQVKNEFLYQTVRGKDNHKLAHIGVVGLPNREANQKHPIPFIYMTRVFAESQGDPDNWIVRISPVLP